MNETETHSYLVRGTETVSPRDPRIASVTDRIGRGEDRTCSVCGRYSGIHKRCVEHSGAQRWQGVYDLVEQAWTYERLPPSYTNVVVTAERPCCHGFGSWMDCPACTSEADFDRGVL